MAKYLTVFSDVHGNYDNVKKLYGDFTASNHVVFLGDGYRDVQDANFEFYDKFIGVQGNCDIGCLYRKEVIFQVESVTVLAVHGDLFGVKVSTKRLVEYAKKRGASLVLYGHTHIKDYKVVDGITLVNPGTLSNYGTEKTFAFITIENSDIKVKHLPIFARF